MSFVHKSIYLLLIGTLTAMTSCVHDSYEEPSSVPNNKDNSEIKSYLLLTFSMAGDTSAKRSEESSGGNNTYIGSESGSINDYTDENTVNNLSIFIYKDQGAGLDADYKFEWKRYVEMPIEITPTPSSYDKSYSVQIPITQAEYEELETKVHSARTVRAVIIANAGDITDNYDSVKSLTESTDYSTWTTENNKTSNFVMSSAYNGAKYNDDGKVTTVATPTDDVYLNCSAVLQRVAARIDLQLTEENVRDGALIYTVSNTGSSEIDASTVKITNLIPVNVMQKQSYLIKHTTKDVNGPFGVRYCNKAGFELLSNVNEGLNYVFTPHFNNKPYASLSNPEEWYGETAASFLRSAKDLESRSPINEVKLSTRYLIEGATNGEKAIFLTYANENTHSKEVQQSGLIQGVEYSPSDYLTGLLIRAQYQPGIVYKTGDLTQDTDYTPGTDFWLFRQVDNNPQENKNLYFSNSKALEDYIKSLPETGKYETSRYEKGICYYNIWIKHSDSYQTMDDSEKKNDSNTPMKFGIVRNNIYRVSFNFCGIGTPTPELTEPYNVVTRIFVKNWNFRRQPEIIM